ncbi:MAG: tetratricopeptide repeat protein [Nonlabens sp.]|uniref:tetratricopeptide repeat protein n=1 Tax=Nonlabens sp. TaxID=1888209 RepID=UPI003EF1804B
MKIKLTILFLAIAAIGFAQKKEIRKTKSALEKKKFDVARDLFKTIDESALEGDQVAEYEYLKGATLIGNTLSSDASLEDAKKAVLAFDKAKTLGYKDSNSSLVMYKVAAQNKMYEFAKGLVENKKYAEAMTIVDDLYKQNPTDTLQLYQAASLAYQSELYDEAKTRFQKLVDLGYTGKITEYSAIDAKSGKKIVLSKTAIDIGVKTGEFKNATSTTSESKLGPIVNSLVYLYVVDGNQAKAKTLFLDSLKKYPNDKSLENVSSNIYLQLGMMDEYKAAMEKLLNGKKDPVLFENLANAALKAGNYDEAILFYDKSLELQEDNVVALNNAANAFIQVANEMVYDESKVTGSRSEAVKKFNEAKNGTYQKAVDYLEKALKIEPKNKSVAQNLIALYGYFKMDDKAAALKARL